MLAILKITPTPIKLNLGGEKMGKKSQKMDSKAARRIQSSQDKKGSKGDSGFKSRSSSAASKKSNK